MLFTMQDTEAVDVSRGLTVPAPGLREPSADKLNVGVRPADD
jgi:hypothetical protein